MAAGRVRRVTPTDTIQAGGIRVVMHRVGRLEQGPVDSIVTDPAGRFAFRFVADTTAVYLLSARHAGIAYFADPIHTNPERPDTAIDLLVSDTSSLAPVRMIARHVVVSAPDEHDARAVVEVIVLHNAGPLARVSADTTRPTWVLRIPGAATGFTAGQGDFSPETVVRRGDTVMVLAPVAPGDKQVVLEYSLPGDLGAARFPFDEAVPLVNVMLEEKSARVEGGLTTRPDSQTIQGRGFGRWEGPMPAGSALTIRLRTPLRPGRWTLAALVTLLILTLGAGTARALRRTASVPAAPTADDLLEAIARLDASQARRSDAREAVVRAAYESERARLKSALLAALAERGTRV